MSDKPHGPSDAGHGDAHGHHGSVYIQHHYDDAQHQFDSGKLGIWLFLAQEVLFFSALFVAYVLYRHHHPEIYSYAHKYLDVKYGAINTAVLIFSSLTAAWAVRAAQLNQRGLLIGCIVLTISCACGFLVIKYIEYTHKVHEHILFGRYFDPCVSSGERPLLTKNNRCPGHESSVVWNVGAARADSGCFPDFAIDQDAHKEGVQASCSVSEVEIKLDKTGKVVGEKPVKQITEQCPEWELGKEEELEHSKKPCWRPGFQPAVCKIGYSFTWREGESMKYAGPWNQESDCIKERKKKAEELAKATPPGPEPDKCVRSNSVGIIVEHGGHGILPDNIRVKADCKGLPPPAPADADPFAEKEEHVALGQKSATGARHLTTHEQHEIEAAGPPPEHTNMFFTIYFAMTGLHGIHVLVGVFVFIWLLIRAVKGHFTPDYFGPIDFAALYWHIVDLIWIFLFPLLYLIH
ncbi:MAG TPA: cytochrome c oxidase subunit 3 [Acidimicrobiia bacterium]|nr:cytochrome c oxidase subunit 3 [Acidimicrobiia bacterium]